MAVVFIVFSWRFFCLFIFRRNWKMLI